MTFAHTRRSVAIARALPLALVLAACSAGATASPSPVSSASAAAQAFGSSSAGPESAATGACPTTAPPAWSAADTATVTLHTAKGTIVIKVDGGSAPNAAANITALATCGYYNGVVFHRLVPGFVIQGGDGKYGRVPNVDPQQVGYGGPGYTIPDDGVFSSYPRGTVAMARTTEPHSAGSQFFIVLDDGASSTLAQAGTYAILGHVTTGLDAVDAIAAMPNSGGQNNAAIDPVAIDTATVTKP